MSYAEKLARLSYYALALLIAAALIALAWRASWQTPPDPRTGTAGLAVETDAGTGCQYVVTPWGGIFARLGPDGKPQCSGPAK